MAEDGTNDAGKKRPEPPPIEFLKPGEEQPQTPPPPEQPVAWVTRPEDYQRPVYAQGPAPLRTPAEGGTRARLAGVLLLLAGGVGVATVLLGSITPLSLADYATLSKDATAYAINQVCAIIVIWAQAAAFLGGIMALQRMNWKLTVVCGFFATLTLGFIDIFPLASFIGVVGFVLVITARREFLT